MSQNYPSDLAYEYKPMGAWAYFGYSLLYVIPIVGLVFAILNAKSGTNLHKQNHARAFLITLVIGIIISSILMGLFYLSGAFLFRIR